MEQLIQQLKVILGTNFALYFKAHGFHWNVEGSDFSEYHNFLGELYTSLFNNTDIIAEKIRMLDSYAPTTLSRMLELSDVQESDSIPSALVMLADLKKDNDNYIVHIHSYIGILLNLYVVPINKINFLNSL